MAKTKNVLDTIKVGMRFLQNFDKMKKNAADIADMAGKFFGKKQKKDELSDEQLGISKEKEVEEKGE